MGTHLEREPALGAAGVPGFWEVHDSAGARSSIINIACYTGITPLSRVFTYAATKAAVINLSQNLARESGILFGIHINALSPGFFSAEQIRPS